MHGVTVGLWGWGLVPIMGSADTGAPAHRGTHFYCRDANRTFSMALADLTLRDWQRLSEESGSTASNLTSIAGAKIGSRASALKGVTARPPLPSSQADPPLSGLAAKISSRAPNRSLPSQTARKSMG